MNIFYLHEDAREAARMHCDDHVRKMLVEYCQMMSTTWAESPDETDRRTHQEKGMMKSFHKNHPSTRWCRDSMFNYAWVFSMWEELQIEYAKLYGKQHKTVEHHESLMYIPSYLRQQIEDVDDVVFAPPPMCFGKFGHIKEGRDPESNADVVSAYHQYYREAKSGFAKWTGDRRMPRWYLTVV